MCVDTVLSEHKPANTGMARKEPHELFVLDSLFHFLPQKVQSSLPDSDGQGILRERGLEWRHWFAVCTFPVVLNKEYLGWVGQPGEIKGPYGKEFDWEGSCRGQLEWKPSTMFNYVSRLLMETEGLSFSSHGLI